MKDNDIYGQGNAYTTEFREVDPRLGGRWWSIDPKTKAYESPYVGFSDNPIHFSDPAGDDPNPSDNTSSNNTVHEVKKGETLSGIAKANGVSLKAIEDANKNNVADPNKIYPGQDITVPSKSASNNTVNNGGAAGATSNSGQVAVSVTGGSPAYSQNYAPENHPKEEDNSTFGIDVSFGAQIGFKEKTPLHVDVSGDVNLFAATLYSAQHSTTGGTTQNYIGKGGKTEITQDASVGILGVGTGITHSFNTTGEGGSGEKTAVDVQTAYITSTYTNNGLTTTQSTKIKYEIKLSLIVSFHVYWENDIKK